jgi:hypothetical protein
MTRCFAGRKGNARITGFHPTESRNRLAADVQFLKTPIYAHDRDFRGSSKTTRWESAESRCNTGYCCSRMDTVPAPFPLFTTRSSFPSPLKSAATIAYGVGPTA